MSNDRELLELAAKAAGYDIYMAWTEFGSFDGYRIGSLSGDTWNPLADDGAALRLAVKTGEPFVVRTRCVTTMGGLKEDFDPSIPGDDMRAVRLVIVRAAAEVGKAMP